MTAPAFDVAMLKTAWASRNVQSLMDLYADTLEQSEMDDSNPPNDPRTRSKAAFREMAERGLAAGVRMELYNLVPGTEKAAYSFTCQPPGGGRIMGNSILDVRDGKIVRETIVQVREQKKPA